MRDDDRDEPQASPEAEAHYARAKALRTGADGTRDLVAARVALGLAASAGHVDAMGALGGMYLGGEGGPRDVARAIALTQQAAEAGSPIGMVNLGLAHMMGRGVKRDFVEARRLMGRAWELGNETAAYDLALMHQRGWGGPKDPKQALALFEAAAERGQPNALFSLGLLYARGAGVPRDRERAHALWRASAEAGHGPALARLASGHRFGWYGLRRDPAQRLAWLERAAHLGFGWAQFLLGTDRLFGRGIPRDRLAADHWLGRAQASGYPLASLYRWAAHRRVPQVIDAVAALCAGIALAIAAVLLWPGACGLTCRHQAELWLTGVVAVLCAAVAAVMKRLVGGAPTPIPGAPPPG